MFQKDVKLPAGYEKCTRRVLFDAFRTSGKWYASGNAYILPGEFYFDTQILLDTIDATNDQLQTGSIKTRQYTIVVRERGADNDVFVTRLIAAAVQP